MNIDTDRDVSMRMDTDQTNGGMPGAELAAQDGLAQLEGSIERIVYRNEENGYTVCELATDDGEAITVVGMMPYAGEGEQLKLLGKYETHSTYGRQFKIEYYEKQLPTGKDAIRRYLSSGAVRGIGPKTAERIVDTFAEDTFEILEKSPEYLSQIPGISAKKAQEIGAHFREQFGMRAVMLFVGEWFGPALGVRIYKRFGSAAVDLIKGNPYILCGNVRGIGFEKADRMAQALGIGVADPFRIQAGIEWFLQENAIQNGHVYLPLEGLQEQIAALLSSEEEHIDEALVTKAIAELQKKGEVVAVKRGGAPCIYLADYYNAEKDIVKGLLRLETAPELLSPADVDQMIRTEEMLTGVEYAPLQRAAIRAALHSGVMILTGGPGTGKTTVIRGVIRMFERLGCEVALAAPTGRAAKRMSEATSHEAKTVHRLLEVEPGSGKEDSISDKMRFRKCEEDPLEEDLIVVDEASMLDTLLMAALLRAMKPGSRLLLIGDADQLPSVGAGNLLHDLIRSERFSTVCLKDIFRQAKESHIVTGAHAINHGELPVLTDKEGDFFFIRREGDEAVAATVADLLSRRLPRTYGPGIREDVQVISPTRKGTAGTVALNALLQSALNPPAPGKIEKKTGERIFREGDRVMQIRNNYDLEWEKEDGRQGRGIFNGDVGRIVEIDLRAERLRVLYDEGRTATYEFGQLDEIEHAFAITVHKSQGSEYPVVVIPVVSGSGFSRLLTRELLYTAVTRAQKMAILIGTEPAIRMMVENSRRPHRYTGLRELLEAKN